MTVQNENSPPHGSRPVVILLNGVGSSGKSTTARAVQEMAARPLLHVAMDAFLDMLPDRMIGHPDGLMFNRLPDVPPTVTVETGPVGQRAFSGMRHAVAAMAQQGNSLIVDDVMLADEAAEYRRLLTEFDLRLVGMFAPLEVLEARERARGDREIGLARWQFDRVHRGISYDLELDSATASAADCARRICAAFDL